MKGKIRVKAETTSYAYVILHDAAEYALHAARDSEEGRFFSCLSSMLYSAFSLEAYLNHLGEHEIPDWESITRYTSSKQKLAKLAENRQYSINFAERPFCTFQEMFDFRKLIVHAKTEVKKIEEIREGTLDEKPQLPRTAWENSTRLENAEIFAEDSASMMRILHPIFGYQTDPFFTEWKSSWETKPV